MKVENSLVKIEALEHTRGFEITIRARRPSVIVDEAEFAALASSIEEWKASDPIWNASAAAPERKPSDDPWVFKNEGAIVGVRLTLHDYELDALIAWHRDQQYETSKHEDYVSAADHKRRREELEKMKGGGK